MKVLLVSGGFTFFADRVQHMLNIDFTRSNILEIADGYLTGRLVDQAWGDICDGAEKRKKLLETCADMGIKPEQSIAMALPDFLWRITPSPKYASKLWCLSKKVA
jgi:phosphoserine phosphatase